jgi:hypothetical protein
MVSASTSSTFTWKKVDRPINLPFMINPVVQLYIDLSKSRSAGFQRCPFDSPTRLR